MSPCTRMQDIVVMASANTESNVTLKLLINRKSSKVLFAEADKAFVDFLFSILALPLGAVTNLLVKNKGMVGSLGTLYKSIESLGHSYIVSDQSKDSVLHPKVALSGQQNTVPLLACEGLAYSSPDTRLWFKCSYSSCISNSVSDQYGSGCHICGRNMNVQVKFLGQPSEILTISGDGAGYVKGVVTYMVMDDLTVKPMSTISGITLLNTFNVRDLGCLEEKTVNLGVSEGLKLLKASLHSETVLTDVFLH